MTFDELLTINPDIKLGDLIYLFLAGMEDKVQFDISVKVFDRDLTYSSVRIIDPKLTPFYEYHVSYLEEPSENSNSILKITLRKD